ncbi:hypothetical protein F2P44_32570 [Massilia sp. CCM 8695]|uniref:JAB domain-containing protein n=1 Tax=Massilia frigida TaxID=2609281 RepID=A0ABX0NJT0_9BURK|nr:Mov34/MPN/PAD-1 family protein [Massilia frigida]NHZ83963.1 hypothetical protein [Massilia frigida]
MNSRKFRLPDGAGTVAFPPSVLNHMYQFAQRRFFAREAGGQLFSPNPEHINVEVTHVSGPNPGDSRSRHGIIWHIGQANMDREKHFASERHAVGLWHTHPEEHPMPSAQDEKTTRQFLEGFHGTMTGFLLIIIGNKGDLPNMAVWLARDGTYQSWIPLVEVRDAQIEAASGTCTANCTEASVTTRPRFSP